MPRKRKLDQLEGSPPDDGTDANVLGTITWLGEGDDGPRSNEWNGIVFRLGEPVEITNPRMMEKAATNRFYRVEPAEDQAEVT